MSMFTFCSCTQAHSFSKSQERGRQCSFAHPPYPSLERETPATFFFFFSLYRLTQDYVMVFVPALPVSFQRLRGPLEVRWYKAAGVPVSSVHWVSLLGFPHVTLARSRSMAFIMPRKDVNVCPSRNAQVKASPGGLVLSSYA